MRKDPAAFEPFRKSWSPLGQFNSLCVGYPDGEFLIPGHDGNPWDLFVKASSGRDEDGTPYRDREPWEHVSVVARLRHGGHRKMRIPTYEEMRRVKLIFWEPEEVAMELHVGEADHISVNNYVLHIWRPIGQTIPTPPKIYV